MLWPQPNIWVWMVILSRVLLAMSFYHAFFSELDPRIEKEGSTERAIILYKLNKSLLEISIFVGIHKQKSLYVLLNEPLYLKTQ